MTVGTWGIVAANIFCPGCGTEMHMDILRFPYRALEFISFCHECLKIIDPLEPEDYSRRLMPLNTLI